VRGLRYHAGIMVEVARARIDIAWELGDLTTVAWERAFDLVVMTGHAFQVLTDDDQLRAALAGIHAALADDGRGETGLYSTVTRRR
jgi:hypothetical protein